MEQNLQKQLRALKAYVALLTIILLIFAYVLFRRGILYGRAGERPHFQEIDVERMNVVDSSGALRMVISNPRRQHPGAMNGKDLPSRERPAGIIFFNDDGDECGGLVYDGNRKEAAFSYSIDQYKNDQIMQWQYDQDNRGPGIIRSYGVKMWDRRDDFSLQDMLRAGDSLTGLHDTAAFAAGIRKMRADGKLSTERLFLGKNQARQVGLFIRDAKGRPRIEIGLDSTGQSIMHLLDTNGRAIPFGR